MSAWDLYTSRRSITGTTRREATLRREKHYLLNHMPDSLSFHSLVIDGIDRSAAVINSDNLDEKTLITMPGETVDCGALVEWMDNHWLVTEKDANVEVYTRAKLEQCNYLLKWVDEKTKTVVERWCIVEDGTKLKHAHLSCNSLACWKRYVKTISLIAGTPLEPYCQNGAANSRKRARREKYKDWAISSQGSNRARFNDYRGSTSRSKRSEMGDPKPQMRHGEDIVYAFGRPEDARNGAELGVAALIVQ